MRVYMPRAIFQITYHLPSAEALITGLVIADDLGEVSFNFELDYFWIDATEYSPYPVIQLARADATFVNLGLWELIRETLPPEAINPELSPAILQIGVAQALAEADRQHWHQVPRRWRVASS
jgi:hypothetical protein